MQPNLCNWFKNVTTNSSLQLNILIKIPKVNCFFVETQIPKINCFYVETRTDKELFWIVHLHGPIFFFHFSHAIYISILEDLIHSTVKLHAQYKFTLNTTHYVIFKRPKLLKNVVKLLVTPHRLCVHPIGKNVPYM